MNNILTTIKIWLLGGGGVLFVSLLAQTGEVFGGHSCGVEGLKNQQSQSQQQ